MKCFVTGCNNSRKDSKNITFHRIPEHNHGEWMKAMGQPRNLIMNSHRRICSEHFTEDSFNNVGHRRNLKVNSFPTLKLGHTGNTSNIPEAFKFLKHQNTRDLELDSKIKKRNTFTNNGYFESNSNANVNSSPKHLFVLNNHKITFSDNENTDENTSINEEEIIIEITPNSAQDNIQKEDEEESNKHQAQKENQNVSFPVLTTIPLLKHNSLPKHMQFLPVNSVNQAQIDSSIPPIVFLKTISKDLTQANNCNVLGKVVHVPNSSKLGENVTQKPVSLSVSKPSEPQILTFKSSQYVVKKFPQSTSVSTPIQSESQQDLQTPSKSVVIQDHSYIYDRVGHTKRNDDTSEYFESFVEDDLNCPIKRHEYWLASRSIIEKYKKKNARIKRQNKHYKKMNIYLNKLLSMNDLQNDKKLNKKLNGL